MIYNVKFYKFYRGEKEPDHVGTMWGDDPKELYKRILDTGITNTDLDFSDFPSRQEFIDNFRDFKYSGYWNFFRVVFDDSENPAKVIMIKAKKVTQ